MTKLTTLFLTATLLALRPAMAMPQSLTNAAKTAFADIQKAKTALDAGNTKTSQSWLTKSESLLKGVLDKAPGGRLLTKTDQAADAAQQGNAKQSQGAAAQAQAEAQKLDPSLGAQLGQARQQAGQGDTSSASSSLDQAKSAISAKTGLGELFDVYQKVSAARSLLKGGEASKAKGLLDEIPSFSSIHLP